MSLSTSVAVKGPLSWSRVSVLVTLVSLLFYSHSISSEASSALPSSLKSLQTRFHTDSIPTTCSAPCLSSFSCQSIPWDYSSPTDLLLTPSFAKDCADYSITRPFGHSILRVHLGVTIPVGVQVKVFLNGIFINVDLSIAIDLFLNAGINTLEIHVGVDACISIYTIKIYEAPPPPPCVDLALISLDVDACLSISLLGTVIRLPISLDVGVYDYTLVRPVGSHELKLFVNADVDVFVIVYLNGVIVSPHPVPHGVVLDLFLAVGVNLIRIDLVKGGCVTHYTCTVN
jgi:hypothetical protein